LKDLSDDAAGFQTQIQVAAGDAAGQSAARSGSHTRDAAARTALVSDVQLGRMACPCILLTVESGAEFTGREVGDEGNAVIGLAVDPVLNGRSDGDQNVLVRRGDRDGPSNRSPEAGLLSGGGAVERGFRPRGVAFAASVDDGLDIEAPSRGDANNVDLQRGLTDCCPGGNRPNIEANVGDILRCGRGTRDGE